MEQSAREQRTDEAKPSQLSVIRLGTERSETTDYRRRDNKTTDNSEHNSCVQRDLVALLLPFIFGAIPINDSARSFPLSNIQLVSFT